MKTIFSKFFTSKQEVTTPNNPIHDMSPLRDLSEPQAIPQIQPQSLPQPQIQPKPQTKIEPVVNSITETKPQTVISSTSLLMKEPQYLRKETLQSSTGEIVIVNKEPIIRTKEGYYYKKYKEQLLQLNISPNLSIERNNMKVGFDKEIINYLFNDLGMIFNQRSTIIDQNQKTLLDEIEKSKELISAYSLLQRNTNASFDNHQKDIKMMKELDQLELLINSIDATADNLLNEVNILEEQVQRLKESKL